MNQQQCSLRPLLLSNVMLVPGTASYLKTPQPQSIFFVSLLNTLTAAWTRLRSNSGFQSTASILSSSW